MHTNFEILFFLPPDALACDILGIVAGTVIGRGWRADHIRGISDGQTRPPHDVYPHTLLSVQVKHSANQ